MNGVLGLAQHLAHLDARSGAAQRGRGHPASRAAALLQIIDDILDFSKLEAGKLRIDPDSLRAAPSSRDVTKLLEPRRTRLALGSRVAVASDVPVWLLGDGGRIRQVLVNLGATPSSSRRRAASPCACAAIRCCDGIAAHALRGRRHGHRDSRAGARDDLRRLHTGRRLHDPAFRRHGPRAHISRELVSCMGGELGVESEEGRGSTFWFVVPLPVCERPALAAETLSTQGQNGRRRHGRPRTRCRRQRREPARAGEAPRAARLSGGSGERRARGGGAGAERLPTTSC